MRSEICWSGCLGKSWKHNVFVTKQTWILKLTQQHNLPFSKPFGGTSTAPSNQSAAIVLARKKDVVIDKNILFGLLAQTEDEKGMESCAGLTNVIPKGRIYTMSSVNELKRFKAELFKRPMVLQPFIRGVRGIANILKDCVGINKTFRDDWVMLINQTHPKILGRIQMGFDAAKQSMIRGEPYILQFCFTEALERLYFKVIDSQRLDYNSFAKELKSSDIQFADLVIRYEGDEDHQGIAWNMKTQIVTFKFEDLLVGDVVLRNKNYARERLSNDPVTLGEIRSILRGWTFEEVPMSDPARQSVAYSYQAANRLYRQLDEAEGATAADHQPRMNLRKYDGRNMSRLPEEDDDILSEDHIDPRLLQDDRPQNFMSRAVIHGHQGSNRSTASSSEADSGFYGNEHDTDYYPQRAPYSKGYAGTSREVSDFNSPKHQGYEISYSSTSEERYSPVIQDAYHNPGFERSPEPKNIDILKKHKELAAKMLQSGPNNNNEFSARSVQMKAMSNSPNYSHDASNVYNANNEHLLQNQGARLKSPSTSSQGQNMSESFI